MSHAELSDYLWVPIEAIDVRQSTAECTYRSRFKNKDPIRSCERRDDMFGYPRNNPRVIEMIRSGGIEVMDKRSVGTPALPTFTGTLREHQIPLMEQYKRYIEAGNTDVIINADTGSGKTVVILNMLVHLGTTAIVVVPKSDLVDQWIERIVEFTDIPREAIGVARQKKCEYKRRMITIGMLQSLMKDKYGEEFKQYYGVAVFDEIHRLGAMHFSKVAGMFPAYYRIGATATLRRSDGLIKLVHDHLGRNVIQASESDQPIPKVAVLTYGRFSGAIPKWATDDVQRRSCLINCLVRNRERTGLVAKFAHEIMKSGRRTLIVSERTRHLDVIKEILLITYNYKDKDIGIYIGDTPKAERERQATECIGILATTRMLGEGTDIPTLRGLILATPVADAEQIMGRIRRICPDVKEPFLVDIIDAPYPEAVKWGTKRRRLYLAKGCEIHKVGG